MRKLGNRSQLRSAEEITISGKHCIWVHNGALEFLFNKDNALDIVWAIFRGVNISFLSKNGLNDGNRDFAGNFEGGFLYTCGMDNVSSCVSDKPVHGSLHYQKCKHTNVYEDNGVIHVCDEVSDSALFGQNLILKRHFSVTENNITLCDTVENLGFTESKHVLLYHINYGYPFLDECLQLDIPAIKSEPLTPIAQNRIAELRRITAPIDGGEEDVYYHTLSEGRIRLTNPLLKFSIEMLYDTSVFPVTLEWKSMISGDYALGIEPSLTRFDRFSMKTLDPSEKATYTIHINFGNI